jgi:hypothetical protein
VRQNQFFKSCLLFSHLELTIDSWFYSERLISAILEHNQVKCLDVSDVTNMVFIDLLAGQRNLRPAEEGLAIVEAGPATQKRVRLVKPLRAGPVELPGRSEPVSKTYQKIEVDCFRT